jgi:hypothetical protein
MSTFTVQDVVTEVRRAVQDTSGSAYRYSDAHIVGVVNQTVKRIALLRPDLFSYVTTYVCTTGARQTLPADCFRLVDVFQVTGGANVNEVNRESLDLLLSSWQAGTTAPAQDWMRHVRNPNLFFVYPPAAAGQSLDIEYCQVPANKALTETIPLLSDVYFPCLVDGVVYLLESVDNEHVNSGRAKLMLDSFMQLLGATVQTKQVADFEQGGEDPKSVY